MANIRRSRAGGFLRGGVRRRETLWIGASFFDTTLAASTSVLIASLNAGALALRPFTVVRARSRIMIRSDQEAASETSRAAFGMCVVSDQASAIGISAVPTPGTDSASDAWFMFEFLPHHLAVTPAGTGPSYSTYDADSKAMRKVEDGFDVIQVGEQVAAVGCVVTGAVRMLVKLH